MRTWALFCATICLLTGNLASAADDLAIPPLKLAETRPNICFVNVASAVSAQDFARAVSNACNAQLQIYYQTAEMADFSGFMNLVTGRKMQMLTFGEHVKLVVYVVNSDSLPGILSIPGQCALINVRRMRLDKPAEEVYQKRLTKIAMKGLALACGVSGNSDPRCVMFWQSFSVGGIDATTASYGPQSYFILQDLLIEFGTREMFRPAP
jgi:predicted Zn-dependent protease